MKKLDELIVVIIGILVGVLILTIGAYYVHKDFQISQSIKNGKNPVSIGIAFDNSYANHEKMIYLLKEKFEESNNSK